MEDITNLKYIYYSDIDLQTFWGLFQDKNVTQAITLASDILICWMKTA